MRYIGSMEVTGRRVAAAVGLGLGVVAVGYWALKPSPPAAAADAPMRVAVLVAPELPAGVSDDAWQAALTASKGATFLVGPLTSAGAPAEALLAGEGGDAISRKDDLQEKVAELEKAYRTYRTATRPGTVMDGLYALAQHIAGASSSANTVNVALLGPLTEVTTDIDLNDPVMRGDPAQLVKQVAGMLPSCSGWNVSVVGGSTVNGRPADVQTDQAEQEFYRQLFASCGGRLAVWDGTQLGTFPSSAKVQPVRTTRACEPVFPLSGDLLFDSGSATLTPSGEREVRRLARRVLVTHPGAAVTVDGYTDSAGEATGYDNQGLSTHRAAAAAAIFREVLGSSAAVAVHGHGADDPVATNTTPDGRELNRRVTVTVNLPQPASCTGE